MSEDKELTPEELKAELEAARAQLKRVNAESAERRHELERLAKEEEERKKETLSDAEKLQSEIAEMKTKNDTIQAQLKAERIRTAIITEAIALGFANPEHAFALVDKSEVVMADGLLGTVTGFEKSLKALAESGDLPMKDQKRSDGLGTPQGKGKAPTGLSEQEDPIVRF